MHQLPQKKGGRASIYDEFTKATENRKFTIIIFIKLNKSDIQRFCEQYGHRCRIHKKCIGWLGD